MGLAPRTQFVARGDGHIAYQLHGNGPAQLLMVTGLASNVEMSWRFPMQIVWWERLAQLAQVAAYDLRGYGLSDRLPDRYGVEDLAADALAVCDAAGFEQPTLWADATGAAVAIWLAVHAPERVRSLVIENGSVCRRWHPDYEIGLRDDVIAERRELFSSMWGTGFSMALFAPSHVGDERLVEDWARYESTAATPSAVLAGFDLAFSLDVRALVPKVTQPTFIYHSVSNALTPVAQGRYIAEHIAHAQYVELDDLDALDAVESDEFLGAVSEFLTGNRTAVQARRQLAVIVFTDIAGSTDRAMLMGDAAWRGLLGEFRMAVTAILERYGATQVNTRGDDVLMLAPTPTIAVNVARAIRETAAGLGLAVRTGLHLGEVERLDHDVAGVSVHIAARVAEFAEPDQILVSQTVRDALIGSRIELHPKGTHHLKGIPGDWHICAVDG